jgi:hypothetical protein
MNLDEVVGEIVQGCRSRVILHLSAKPIRQQMPLKKAVHYRPTAETVLELAKIAGASLNETEVLKRNTPSPRMDFVVLPLTPGTAPEIEKAIVSKAAFKDQTGIVHVQIERQGRLAFVACDNFHEDCVWVSEAVPATFLAELVKNQVLYSYAPA